MRVHGSVLRGFRFSRFACLSVLLGLLGPAFPSPAEAQILDRLRRRAEDALDQTDLIQRLLEEPPGITTTIADARAEVPFLDDHDPPGSASMASLPRNEEYALFAPPGLYDMEALSYCIHAGTYGPTEGEGYSLAPLQGDLAPVLETLVRSSIAHPEISQPEIQSLIWALQSRIPINELPPELRVVAETLLAEDQLESLSEGVVDLAKEELMSQARDRMPDPVRRVAEVEASLRELLRSGAVFEELEYAAVLVGAPPLEEQVRDVPAMRWNYHPDGYFIRFQPADYTETYVQIYVPEPYRLARDGQGRIQGIAGPLGVRLEFDYQEGTPGVGGRVGLLRTVRMLRDGRPEGEWPVDVWTFLGEDLAEEIGEDVIAQAELRTRGAEVRELHRQNEEVISSARGSGPGSLGEGLTDLGHLRMALREASGFAAGEAWIHLANAWQYALCVEAGGCGSVRVASAEPLLDSAVNPRVHGPAVMPRDGAGWANPTVMAPRAGGAVSIDPGGNVATPGNTGAQRLLQSGKPVKEKADLAMKALGVFLALADVIASGNLGAAAYNALGLGGLPVGHLGIPTMLAGAMISQVTDVWSTATDALAGDTGSGGAGDDVGGGDGSEGGDDLGWSGGPEGGAGEFGGPGKDDPDPSDQGVMGAGENRAESRFSGDDYENTPPPMPPPNPTPAPPSSGASGERTDAANSFTQSLITTLYHTQAVVDSQQRQEAACQAGDSEWASRQAALAGEHRDQAGRGMMEAARKLEKLLAIAEAEGALEGSYGYPEDVAGVQDRLSTEGWSAEEMEVAGLLGITQEEMEGLRGYLLDQDPEGLSGDFDEAVEVLAGELRTAGILWMALPHPPGGCGQSTP